MERMLRKKKDNSEYEIDRELTGKFAIEKNAEYQEKIEQLEEENKNLKSDLAYERTMLDNVRAEYKSLQSVIKKLKDIYGEANPTQKSKPITVTDEDNRIILEKGEDGKWHSYGGGNVVLC